MEKKGAVTKEAVREAFIFENSADDLREVADCIRKEITMDSMAEILDSIVNDANRTAAESGKNMYERILWIMKEAYVEGFAAAYNVCAETVKSQYADLFGNEG